MVRLALDPAGLARIERSQRLPPRHGDLGYAVHAALAGLFGEGVLQPYRVQNNPRGGEIPVLAYSPQGADALRARAETFADPEFHAACRWDEFATKPMPISWERGARLGFEVRVCPVVRLASAIETETREGEKRVYRRRAEIDVWVHRRWLRETAGATTEGREGIYRQWLAERLAPAAELLAARLKSFRRLQLVRKDHQAQRHARVFDRPDALFVGDLEVRDAAAFQRLLASGVGRHCAYGFGMLLLRPSG
jgi:CRISPR system Cascade subunit CasE